MAYKIKRNRVYEELCFEDNGKELNLQVDVNIDSILDRYTKAQIAIARASEDAKKAVNDKDIDKAEEAMGSAIIGLFTIVFGADQTGKIVEFYDGNMLEMLGDVIPFITDVIEPKIAESRKNIENRYRQVAKRGK